MQSNGRRIQVQRNLDDDASFDIGQEFRFVLSICMQMCRGSGGGGRVLGKRENLLRSVALSMSCLCAGALTTDDANVVSTWTTVCSQQQQRGEQRCVRCGQIERRLAETDSRRFVLMMRVCCTLAVDDDTVGEVQWMLKNG